MNKVSSTDSILQNNSITIDIKKTGQKDKWLNTAIKVAVVAVIWAHFIWATQHFITHTEESLNDTTCNGYGFWMILFIFINAGIAYNFVFSKYVLPYLLEWLWKPVRRLFKKFRYAEAICYVIIFALIFVFLILDASDNYSRLIPLSGLAFYFCFGFVMSNNKSAIAWITVIRGFIIQFLLGLMMIRWKVGRNIFECLGVKFTRFLDYSVDGSVFVYGQYLVLDIAVFAFRVLPIVLFLNFVVNILYYYGIMQEIIARLGECLQWIMGTTICESVTTVANIFLGPAESTLVLKPYLSKLTDSEIYSVMTIGFATASGSVMAGYISFGASPAHLIISTVISAPAGLCFSKLMYPETEEVLTTKESVQKTKMEFESVLTAASKGALDGAHIVLGILASMITFTAFVAFLNGVLSWFGVLVGFTEEGELWTLELILGKIFIPLTYTMGIEWADCEKVGQVIGEKTIINGFIAFSHMQQMEISARSRIIATYAVCSFAHPSSVGIFLSTMGILSPDKREVLARVVMRSFVAGCATTFMTACIAALLIPDDI